jgi:hypothetical protein
MACTVSRHRPGAFEHVGLVHGSYFFAAGPGGFEGPFGNAFHLVAGVDHRVEGRVAVVAPFAGLAEVHVAGEFAEKQDVGAAQDFGLDAGGVEQFVEELDGPQVGVQAEFLAHPQQALLGTHFRRGVVVVAGVAHGPEEDGVGGPHLFEGFVGQRVAGRLDGRVADQGVVEGKGVVVFPADGFEHFPAPGGYFRADAVAGHYEDFVGFLRHVFLCAAFYFCVCNP